MRQLITVQIKRSKFDVNKETPSNPSPEDDKPNVYRLDGNACIEYLNGGIKWFFCC